MEGDIMLPLEGSLQTSFYLFDSIFVTHLLFFVMLEKILMHVKRNMFMYQSPLKQ